jgi:hypothetical protein
MNITGRGQLQRALTRSCVHTDAHTQALSVGMAVSALLVGILLALGQQASGACCPPLTACGYAKRIGRACPFTACLKTTQCYIAARPCFACVFAGSIEHTYLTRMHHTTPSGRSLYASSPPPLPTPACLGQHDVVAGDTLAIIADEYDTTLAAIEALNSGLSPYDLQVGSVVIVPGVLRSLPQEPCPTWPSTVARC